MKTEQLDTHDAKALPKIDVQLLGRRINFMTAEAIVAAVHNACLERKKIVVAHYNVHGFNLSMQLPWFFTFLQNADIVHCDGMGVLKAAHFMGIKLSPEYRASYTMLMPELLDHCSQHGLSIFFLGSKPEHLAAALARLKRQYPNLELAGHHGYFAKEDFHQNESVIQQINSNRPNILIVGMGMPIQEYWIWQNYDRLHVNVIMPGGAVIDRMAGIVSDCPKCLSNLGLEWLYRLCKEPKRLAVRYLLGNPAFVFHLLLYKFNVVSSNSKVIPSVGRSGLKA